MVAIHVDTATYHWSDAIDASLRAAGGELVVAKRDTADDPATKGWALGTRLKSRFCRFVRGQGRREKGRDFRSNAEILAARRCWRPAQAIRGTVGRFPFDAMELCRVFGCWQWDGG